MRIMPPKGRHIVGDVIVVGAGVVGLATAWELCCRGLSVVVIDPAPAMGASRAAAGMLAPAGEVKFQQAALYPLMKASAAEYSDFVERLEVRAGIAAGYRRSETLLVAADRADLAELEALQTVQEAQSMPVERMSTRAARALEPALSPRISGAVRAPGDHQIDPRRLATALQVGVEASGSTFVRDSVRSVSVASRGDHSVQTASGETISAPAVVLASGLGLADIAGCPSSLQLPLRPVYGDILRTQLPAGAPQLLERTVRGVVNGAPVYLVPREDGEIVIGATSREDFRPAPSAGGVWRLLDDARRLVPGVADLEFVEALARARPGTPDDLPYVGQVREPSGEPVRGLFVSTGHFRHGVLLAPLAARLVSSLIAGDLPATDADASHLAAMDPHRHSAVDSSGAESRPRQERSSR